MSCYEFCRPDLEWLRPFWQYLMDPPPLHNRHWHPAPNDEDWRIRNTTGDHLPPLSLNDFAASVFRMPLRFAILAADIHTRGHSVNHAIHAAHICYRQFHVPADWSRTFFTEEVRMVLQQHERLSDDQFSVIEQLMSQYRNSGCGWGVFDHSLELHYIPYALALNHSVTTVTPHEEFISALEFELDRGYQVLIEEDIDEVQTGHMTWDEQYQMLLYRNEGRGSAIRRRNALFLLRLGVFSSDLPAPASPLVTQARIQHRTQAPTRNQRTPGLVRLIRNARNAARNGSAMLRGGDSTHSWNEMLRHGLHGVEIPRTRDTFVRGPSLEREYFGSIEAADTNDDTQQTVDDIIQAANDTTDTIEEGDNDIPEIHRPRTPYQTDRRDELEVEDIEPRIVHPYQLVDDASHDIGLRFAPQHILQHHAAVARLIEQLVERLRPLQEAHATLGTEIDRNRRLLDSLRSPSVIQTYLRTGLGALDSIPETSQELLTSEEETTWLLADRAWNVGENSSSDCDHRIDVESESAQGAADSLGNAEDEDETHALIRTESEANGYGTPLE